MTTVHKPCNQTNQEADPTDAKVRINLPTFPLNTTFPYRLHKVLEHAKTAGYESVVSWFPDGRSFRVHNQKVFVETIVPAYFCLTKYKSFLRQLTIYGFQRINRGDFKGGYFHPLFTRKKPYLVSSIARKPRRKTERAPRSLNESEFKISMISAGIGQRLLEPNILSKETESTFLTSKIEPRSQNECPTSVFKGGAMCKAVCGYVSFKEDCFDPVSSEISSSIEKKLQYDDLSSSPLESYGTTMMPSGRVWWHAQDEELWDYINDLMGTREEVGKEELVDEIISTFSR